MQKHPIKSVAVVEKELEAIIKRYKLAPKVTLKFVKDMIFKNTGTAKEASGKYFRFVIDQLSSIKDMDELNATIQIFSDAWNAFPHRVLQGKSPRQILEEERVKGKEGEVMIGLGAGEVLGNIYHMARERAKMELDRIGGTIHDFNNLERAISGSGEDKDRAIMKMLVDLRERDHKLYGESFEPFMREYQAMDNHKIIHSKDDNQYIYSLFLSNALNVIREKNIEDFSIPEFMTNTFEIHDMMHRYAIENKIDRRAISVAHHIYDWLAMISPEKIIKRKHRENMALCFGIVTRVHHIMFDSQSPMGEINMIAEWGGYKNESSFSKILSENFLNLVYAVEDPHMLMVYATDAPTDWFSRFKVAAPKLQDHFDEERKNNSTAPIPSPWMFM